MARRVSKEPRRLPGCAAVPVVVLTARDLTREEHAMLRGASQVLNKGDVSLKELVERLHGLSANARCQTSERSTAGRRDCAPSLVRV